MKKRIFPLFLILALLLCACGKAPAPEASVPEEAVSVPETQPEETASEPTEATEPEPLPPVFWKHNVLRRDYLEVLGVPRGSIRTATFLLSRRDAPAEAVELSADTGSVLGWVQDGEHLFIAADAGINGAESAPGLFAGCVSLETVSFGDAYRTDLAQSLTGMFSGCMSLRTADTGKLVTSGVTDLSGVFSGCMSLEAPEVSLWDTSSVTDMTDLFSGCMSLETLDVARWNVAQVRTLDRMFAGCTGLRQLECGQWTLDSARSMEEMFLDCAALLRIGGFPFDHAAVSGSTFSGCGDLPR